MRHARKALEVAIATNKTIPARVRLGELNPGQQVSEVQVKLLAHVLGTTVFNTEMTLARDIRINTGYRRAEQDAHAWVRAASKAAGTLTRRWTGC